MKNPLLITCCIAAIPFAARAHQVDPYTIFYDDDELVSLSNPNGTWDPNGNVPPQPEADYYVNMHNATNVYYRLEAVEGTSPAEYQCHMPILQGNFKIYSKEYWSERGTSGYDGNRYVYGSRSEPTGFMRDTYKELGNPGGDMQIEGGGTWYGCTISFWPQGHDGNGIPDLKITGGEKDTQNITIKAVGKATGNTSGDIDVTIGTGGIVKPAEQIYTVSIAYTDADGKAATKSMQVKGLKGTFADVENLKPSSATKFNVTAEIKNAPYFNNPANPEQIAGYKDFTATTDAEIITDGSPTQKAPIYLIGNIYENEWQPQNALDGEIEAGNSNVVRWHNIVLVGDRRFRFVSQKADWNIINAQGTQYYPTEATSYCANYANSPDSWYQATAGKQTDNAWAPSVDTKGGALPMYYDIFYDMATNKVAIGWWILTGTDDAAIVGNDAPVTVYNMMGVAVRENVTRDKATDGLARGIYIIDGKKVFVH